MCLHTKPHTSGMKNEWYVETVAHKFIAYNTWTKCFVIPVKKIEDGEREFKLQNSQLLVVMHVRTETLM
jgi:hypothetical protein